MALPFLLAGPIVRRVEPRLVSVWVATSEACGVGLKVWPGPVTAGPGTGGAVFTAGGETASGARETVRVGAGLHIAVVTASTVGNQPLLPGTRFSYNVTFTPADGGEARDLHSLGLLADRPEQPALGYQAGLLPSLATCPATIDDLVLVHGSCNRIEAGGGPNLMFAIDELIDEALDDARRRPHQLWLSGDQVYSDEVAAALSVGLTARGRELLGADELLDVRVEDEQLGLPLRQANVPAGYRQKLMSDEARLTSGEAASHLLGMTERMAMQLHLWSPEVWERKQDGTVFLPAVDDVLPSREPPLLDALEEAAGLSPAQIAAAKAWLADHLQTFEDVDAMATAVREARDERDLVLAYAAQVGRIRRALANVTTYFVFDDHDVTDDWNLCRVWRERVEGNGLGRSVVRDGLVTYALTQGWGNDPAAFEGGPGAQLLDAVGRLFPPSAATGPDPAAAVELDALLGLGGQPALVRWNYAVDGAVHRVLACDTRTRRGFTGPVSPPVQLPDGEREAQIPAGPLPAGLELLIVVLSQPVLDPVLLGELTQGLVARGAAALGDIKDKMDLPPDQARAVTGLETLDYEGWGARPQEIARLLDRLATYDRVLVMSGDVHFAVSLGLSYWRRGQGLVSTIGQFTSSAVQYITYPEILVPLLGQGWANDLLGRGYPFDLLVWRDPVDPPVTAPSLPARGLRRRLRQRPVLLPTRGWPADTEVTIPPDAAWRLQMIADERPDEDRPEPVRAEPLTGEFDASDPLRGERGYGGLARRHSAGVRKHANTRRIGIFNKVARLTFAHDGDGRLVATSELLSIDHHGESAAGPEPFTVHRLVYDAPTTTPEPTIAG
jgi:hypothetical protein